MPTTHDRPIAWLRTLRAALVCLLVVLATTAARCEDEPPPERDRTWIAAAPAGFVEVDPNRPYVWRAVAADGSAIGVRHRNNDEGGDLDFWTEVFERELTLGKGYRLAESTDVTSADGVSGRVLHLELAEQDRPFHYGLAVYVTDDSLVTVETAAELETLETHAAPFTSVREGVHVRTAETE